MGDLLKGGRRQAPQYDASAQEALGTTPTAGHVDT